MFCRTQLTLDSKQLFASLRLRAARASCGSSRPAGAAAAPPRSPRSVDEGSFVLDCCRGAAPAARRGNASFEPSPRFNAWRLHQLLPPSGSARLVLPAEARALRARRLRRPARRARWIKEVLCLTAAGALPLQPHPHVWTLYDKLNGNSKEKNIYTIY